MFLKAQFYINYSFDYHALSNINDKKEHNKFRYKANIQTIILTLTSCKLKFTNSNLV